MISKYVNADKSFEADAFVRFVKKNLADQFNDAKTRQELVGVAKDYAATRKQADARTLTGKRRK